MGVVLVTGAGGLLGREVVRVFGARGDEVHPFAHAQLDTSDAAAVHEAVGGVHPSLVIDCAALTNVDLCETDPDRAWAVNAEGPGNVAGAAADAGAEVVAISTDYVFDGEKGSYVESDAPNPIQVYGRAKLAGEERAREANPRVYVVRSAWIFGAGGRNFLSQMPGIVEKGEPFRAVGDQRSSPTYAPDLAEAIAGLAGTGAYGTYHVTNGGSSTHVEFARALIDALASDVTVDEIAGRDLARRAPRPRDTSLVGEAWRTAGFAPLPPWRDAAERYARGGAATLP